MKTCLPGDLAGVEPTILPTVKTVLSQYILSKSILREASSYNDF